MIEQDKDKYKVICDVCGSYINFSASELLEYLLLECKGDSRPVCKDCENFISLDNNWRVQNGLRANTGMS